MLTLNPGQVFDSNYELKRLIDTGGFADVWEATYLVAGNTVALKIYPRLDEEGINNIEAEYKKLFELQHSNLVNALHFGKCNGYPYLVMRFYPGGNAAKKIGSCNEQEIAKCISQIGSALKYLHANDFIHQDIKPNNFLLDQYGNYYLSDLGLSHKVINTIKMQTEAQGNRDLSTMHTGLTPPPYRAPELYNRQRENNEPVKATDIWALGASAYQMITGQVPFGDLGGLMQLNDPVIKDLPNGFSTELNNIIKDCLQKEPQDRPSALALEDWATSYLNMGKTSASTSQEWSNVNDNNRVHKVLPKKQIASKKKKSKLIVISVITISVITLIYFLFSGDLFNKKEVASAPAKKTTINKTDTGAKKPSVENITEKINVKNVKPFIKTVKPPKTEQQQREADIPKQDKEQNVGEIKRIKQ